MNARLCFLVLLLALALPLMAQQTLNLVAPPTACLEGDPSGTLTCGWKNASTGCYETLSTGFPDPPYGCSFGTGGFADAWYSYWAGCAPNCTLVTESIQCNGTFEMTNGGPGVCRAISSLFNFTYPVQTRTHMGCGQCGYC